MARPMLRCHGCRSSLLEAFTSFAGISLRAPRLPPRRANPVTTPARSLHTSRRYFQELQTQELSDPDQIPNNTSENEAFPDTSNDAIPWYLSIPDPLPPLPPNSSTPTSSTPLSILARQQIPALPASPPAILSPLLEHLSISIGLDDLTLLDLRSLNPSPALGANLIMIIGTARSVKHLNVSADRFCRWLRAQYKLRPYADGLLGRNELKIRLRRKARRMNLARAAGRIDVETGQAGGAADDGITTGWVCVNVGAVDDAVMPEADVEMVGADSDAQIAEEYANEEEYVNPEDDGEADPSYIGFGSRSTSQRIVVQMFTEDKRAEMDLETLYANRTTRTTKREAEADVAVAEAQARAEESWWRGDEKKQRADAEEKRKGTEGWSPLFK